MARKIKTTERAMGTIRSIEGTRRSSSSATRSVVSGRYVKPSNSSPKPT